MGIDTLEDFLQNNGKNKLIELLSTNKVTITEKINAHRVSILKDRLNNIEFYGKKKSMSINTIDRIISDLYDPFIQFILQQKDNIQQGIYNFYFTYHNIDITYTKKPKNNLLLTNANCFLKDKKQYHIKDIASDIDVVPQTIIYNSKLLKKKHINHIINYIENGGILPKIMDDIFGNACNLSESNTDIIEGYIFKVNNNLYKLTDNRFKRKLYPKINTASYEMLVMEICNFMSDLDYTTIKLNHKNKDLRYANFIFNAFNIFIKEYGESFLITPPSFIINTGNICKRYITNQETLSYLSDERYSYLLKIFLNIFTRPLMSRGLFTKDFIDSHLSIYENIKKYINSNDNIFDFNEFKMYRNK